MKKSKDSKTEEQKPYIPVRVKFINVTMCEAILSMSKANSLEEYENEDW